MKTIEILLRENVDELGRCGDVVQVASGYARNYLLPRGLAIQATAENVRMMQRRRQRVSAEVSALEASADAVVEALEGLRITTAEKADENGHLFGSVNAVAVARLLAAAGHAVEDRHVRLEHPIKSVGEHAIPVHVRGERMVEITLVVEATD